jgi:hypothetical protein
MTTWDELVAGALVGAARRPPALPEGTPGSGLAGVLAAIDRGDPEGAVLEAGAVVGLYRQVGWRPPVDTGPVLPVSPPETRPFCSEAAAARLDAMLDGRFRSVLAEWLTLAAGAGRLAPPDRLPALLDTATTSAPLRAAAVDVAGERGRWLAGLNPGWSWVLGGSADEEGTWATGSTPARRLLLARIRAADPAAARELLASTWTTETPEDRAAFLAALATNLSDDDEPFLEAALDDRRKEVRQAAAGLLCRLPGSRLAGRMAERTRPLVRLTGSVRKRVEAAFPDEVDKAMERDGVVVRPPAGVGERAWWLYQLVAATPLKAWPDALGLPPARLVELAGPALRQAWATAAVRQGDEEWALALLDAGDVQEPALLGAVPHARAVAVAARRVTDLGLTPAVLDELDHVRAPWGPELSRAVVDRLGDVVKQQGRPDPAALALRPRLPDLGNRLDPAVTPVALVVLAEHSGWWSDVVGWFLDLLTFRTEMREELLL